MKDDDKAAMLQRFYKPRAPNEKVQGRKERFATLNAFVQARGGWVTSVPGAIDVTIECLPNSTLPFELREGGAAITIGNVKTELPPYKLDEAGEGERILSGSTVAVKRYAFELL
jgi:hypothetical protein